MTGDSQLAPSARPRLRRAGGWPSCFTRRSAEPLAGGREPAKREHEPPGPLRPASPHALPPLAQPDGRAALQPEVLGTGALIVGALSDVVAFATAPLRWGLGGPGAAGARSPHPPLRPHLSGRRQRDPDAPPHAIDERVDVCHADTPEHARQRHRLRAALRADGAYRAWLDDDHAIMRFMRARQFSHERTLAMLR